VSTDGPALSSQYTGGSSVGGQGNGTVGTLSNADLWRLYWSGAGAGSSLGPANGSLANDPTISAKYTGGSGVGLLFFVTGATGADAASSGSQQVSTGSTTLTLADGQSPVMTTPLVYQPGSDDGPGVVSGVWTGGDGGWQVIQMSDGENSYDDGAPDGEPQGDPWPLRLPGVTGFSQFTSMGEPGWGDDVPVFRPGDVEAARGLTGLAKMVHDHGLPVSRRAADSNGRVVVYTFTDGTTYMEPVEPPSEHYINSAAVMVPGGIALSRGKGLAGAARAIAAEAIDDAATSRASQAANAATGGYLKWIPAPIASILFGGKPKPRVSGVVDDGAAGAWPVAGSGDDIARGGGTLGGKTDEVMSAADDIPVPFPLTPRPVPTASDLLGLGRAAGAGEMTKAGQSLAKHAVGARSGSSAFPAPSGSPANINKQASELLSDILSDPSSVMKQRPGRPGEQLLQIFRPDGSGVIYKWKDTGWVFSHFAENLF
jgi:hypothetical protein